MAMSASGLANEIVSEFEAVYGALSGDAKVETLKYYTIMAKAVINHIIANAEVPVGIGVQVDLNSGSGATNTPGKVK
jgi:hypothetical protein